MPVTAEEEPWAAREGGGVGWGRTRKLPAYPKIREEGWGEGGGVGTGEREEGRGGGGAVGGCPRAEMDASAGEGGGRESAGAKSEEIK